VIRPTGAIRDGGDATESHSSLTGYPLFAFLLMNNLSYGLVLKIIFHPGHRGINLSTRNLFLALTILLHIGLSQGFWEICMGMASNKVEEG